MGETKTQFTCQQTLRQALTMFSPIVYGPELLGTVRKKSLPKTGSVKRILLAMFYLGSRHLFYICQIG